MYCVKCGVRIEEGRDQCPLCGRPVVDPFAYAEQAELEKAEASFDEEKTRSHYNTRLYPKKNRGGRYAALILVTILMVNASVSCFLACMYLYREVAWSGYVMLGCALAYIVIVLPLWFSRPPLIVFFPVDFAAACAYSLFICRSTGGNWFLSFAFPCTVLLFVFSFAAVGIFKIKTRKKTKVTFAGLFFLFLGGGTMLIEFFEHITFGADMFVWSLYTATNLGWIGLFFIVASFITPLRNFLYKKLFV